MTEHAGTVEEIYRAALLRVAAAPPGEVIWLSPEETRAMRQARVVPGVDRIAGAPEPIAYPISKAPLACGVTRSKIYDAIKAKELTARKRGRSTIIEASELRRWIATFPTIGRPSPPARVDPPVTTKGY